MSKKVLLILGVGLLTISCVDKKNQKKTSDGKTAKVEQQIESVESEIDKDLESLKEEANEIENDLKELDKL